MKATQALGILAELTSHQWGMVTSAQARVHGITRLDLSRLAEAGHLKRLAHGIYMDAGANGDQFDDLRAAWLSTDPKVMGEKRIKDRVGGVVVAGASAARLHEIGDFWADRHEFVTPSRRQSQRPEISYRRRKLEPHDVTLAGGLPTMTVERTIADLVEQIGDLSLVADALRDASRRWNLDLDRLQSLLAPLASRNGLKHGDGSALLNRLMEIAGIDPDAVARRVAADASLASRVAATYLGSLSRADLDQLLSTSGMKGARQTLQESFAALVRRSLAPQIAEITSLEASTPQFNAVLDQVSRTAAEQLVDTGIIKQFSLAWAKSLTTSHAVKPETLATIREAQNAVTRG